MQNVAPFLKQPWHSNLHRSQFQKSIGIPPQKKTSHQLWLFVYRSNYRNGPKKKYIYIYEIQLENVNFSDSTMLFELDFQACIGFLFRTRIVSRLSHGRSRIHQHHTFLEPQGQPFYKWLVQLDDSQSLHRKWLFHQTSIYKLLFGAPGYLSSSFGSEFLFGMSKTHRSPFVTSSDRDRVVKYQT